MNDKVLHVCERGRTTMVRCKGAHGPQDLMPTCVRWSVAWPLRVGCAMGRGSSDVARTAPVTPGDRVPPSQHLSIFRIPPTVGIPPGHQSSPTQ